jgi:hypothetical protein
MAGIVELDCPTQAVVVTEAQCRHTQVCSCFCQLLGRGQAAQE